MNTAKTEQFTPYTPTPQELDAACTDFNAVYDKTQEGAYIGSAITEDGFGQMLANERLLAAAIDAGRDDVPELTDEGEIWQLHKQRRDLGIAAIEKCVTCPLFESCAGVITLKSEVGMSTPFEQNRRALQSDIARAVSAQVEGSVLKGGYAMILHGVDRATGDLDFDVFTPMSAGRKRQVESIINRVGGSTEPKKDTDTTVRYKVPLPPNDKGNLEPLKLEFRTVNAAAEDNKDITVVDGIRVYTPEALLRQKVEAFLGRAKARDSVDLSYLVSFFPDTIKTVDSESLQKISQRLRPNNDSDKPNVELGSMEVDENMSTLPNWVQGDVAKRMLTELSAKIDEEIEARAASQ